MPHLIKCPRCRSGNTYQIADVDGSPTSGGNGCRGCHATFDKGGREFHAVNNERKPGPAPVADPEAQADPVAVTQPSSTENEPSAKSVSVKK